jgi:hypothetical protein
LRLVYRTGERPQRFSWCRHYVGPGEKETLKKSKDKKTENNELMSEQKTYFGNGKEHVFNDGGSVIRLSFSAQDLQEMQRNLNERGWINLNVNKRRTPSQYGDTHSISLDTWKPQPQPQPQQYQQQPVPQPQQQVPQQQPQYQQQGTQQAPQQYNNRHQESGADDIPF